MSASVIDADDMEEGDMFATLRPLTEGPVFIGVQVGVLDAPRHVASAFSLRMFVQNRSVPS